jgi:Fe(3+) dicitrate transport protein
VRYRRTNRLAVPGSTGGVTGRTSLTALIPGLGLTYLANAGTTLFVGAHRGFAPPRTEDVIDNTTGGTVDLDPELSWNYELGVRSAPRPGLAFEATLFRMDFDNQVIAASLAGGSGAALTSAGRTRHAGLEVAARLGGGIVGPGLQNFYVRTAYTWLGVARFEGDRFVYLGTSGNDVVGKVYAGPDAGDTRERFRVTGNRLPYAPEHLLTATLGYAHPVGVDFQLEAVSVSRAFGDAANTAVLAPDGQQGPIPGSTVWNGAATVDIRPLRNSVFLSVKNLFDHSYIVDRSRGILPGNPRTVLVGLTYRIGR